jgi:hypothetical protein
LAVPAGLAAAALAYSGFVVAARMAGANRAQFLATPWIGLAVASLMLLACSVLPERARPIVAASLGAFVVATGAARVVQLQRTFDRVGTYRRDSDAVSRLLRLAPALKPGTLVILLDHSRTWLGTFVFHHALDLAYGGGVAGCVPDAPERLFYTCHQGADGVRHEPWPILTRAWGVSPRTYAFDQVVVFRADGSGRIDLLREWPADLPPPPPGAVYAPLGRLDREVPPPRQRSVVGAIS